MYPTLTTKMPKDKKRWPKHYTYHLYRVDPNDRRKRELLGSVGGCADKYLMLQHLRCAALANNHLVPKYLWEYHPEYEVQIDEGDTL